MIELFRIKSLHLAPPQKVQPFEGVFKVPYIAKTGRGQISHSSKQIRGQAILRLLMMQLLLSINCTIPSDVRKTWCRAISKCVSPGHFMMIVADLVSRNASALDVLPYNYLGVWAFLERNRPDKSYYRKEQIAFLSTQFDPEGEKACGVDDKLVMSNSEFWVDNGDKAQ
jgi:hypothetical protein